MGVKEVLQRFGQKNTERKELLRRLDQKTRMEKIIEDRQKSSNERELERYMDEDREEAIKEHLEFARKKRQRDIDFEHNPIDAENIITKTQWEVLKEKSQFSKKSNMFANNTSVLKNNKNLLKTNRNLLKNNKKLFGI